MTNEPKPLVLKDELAKLARRNDVMRWLTEAVADINAFAETNEAAKRAKLSANMIEKGMYLQFHNHFKLCDAAAYYNYDGVLQFRPDHVFAQRWPEFAEIVKISDEQAFIKHVLTVTRLLCDLR